MGLLPLFLYPNHAVGISQILTMKHNRLFKLFPFLFLPLALLILAFAYPSKEGSKDLKKLLSYMEGSYENAEQAQKDTNYFHVKLHMKQIWPSDEKAYWIYVEQALVKAPQKPYRQRVYKIYEQGGEFISEIYTMKQPLRFVGAYKDLSLLGALTPDSLELKRGCEVRLKKYKKGFKGATGIKTCASELNGASYATSIVDIQKDMLISWDRGFNDAGEHIWGIDKGGYRFVKHK
ncbi:MAG: hypothetical protein EAZ57_09105 [Cytophagales bacterium]|nr:MAG: hypothetical protein EAZ67_09915 [Cytophagales bacterium]TAF60054.1 MAG: hypothetical protein EAZ57_09105 [Cytophagales bacterium]